MEILVSITTLQFRVNLRISAPIRNVITYISHKMIATEIIAKMDIRVLNDLNVSTFTHELHVNMVIHVIEVIVVHLGMMVSVEMVGLVVLSDVSMTTLTTEIIMSIREKMIIMILILLISLDLSLLHHHEEDKQNEKVLLFNHTYLCFQDDAVHLHASPPYNLLLL
jgi:hypothetical protein